MFCGKETTGSLIKHKDATDTEYSICSKCNDAVQRHACVKCGNPVDPMLEIKGLCSVCLQVEMKQAAKKREAALMDIGADVIGKVSSVGSDDEERFEQWLMLDGLHAFKPEAMKRNSEYRMLWITFKLLIAGVDLEDHYKYRDSVSQLLDEKFSDLVGQKCSVVIPNTPRARKQLRESEVIGHVNDVYIVKN